MISTGLKQISLKLFKLLSLSITDQFWAVSLINHNSHTIQNRNMYTNHILSCRQLVIITLTITIFMGEANLKIRGNPATHA